MCYVNIYNVAQLHYYTYSLNICKAKWKSKYQGLRLAAYVTILKKYKMSKCDESIIAKCVVIISVGARIRRISPKTQLYKHLIYIHIYIIQYTYLN